MNSSVLAATATVTAAERNALRQDILVMAGEYIITTGGTTAYIATVDAQLVVGDMVAGFHIKIKMNATNTGASTLRIDDSGGTLLVAKAIKKYGSAALVAGDLVSGTVYFLIYDGTNFQIQSELISGNLKYAADAEASDTYVIILSPVPTAYVEGMMMSFKANTANTGACTLNVNGLGAKSIKKLHDQDPVTGDIESGQIVTVVYDGTNFQMQSQLGAELTSWTSDIQTVSSGTSGTVDTVLTPGFQASVIKIDYKLNGTDSGAEQWALGSMMFSGTTLKGGLSLCNSAAAGNITTTTATISVLPSVLNANGIFLTVVLSVLAITATTLTVRLTVTSGSGAGAKNQLFQVTAWK